MNIKEVINFYSATGEYGCFSNFSNHAVNIGGKTWKSSEHYFQAQKFVGTKYESLIRKAPYAGEAAKMGRDRSLPLRKDWESVKDNIMRDVVYAKFTQHKSCKELLLSTGNAKIVEHTENDSYWGDGGDGRGKNRLGQILMEIRERIKNEESNKGR